MTIYQLECFIAVAEELNFSAAAERLFTTQPAITYQINALEKETGLHLFERTTRRTKLTAAGQSFYLDMVQMTSFGRQAQVRPEVPAPMMTTSASSSMTSLEAAMVTSLEKSSTL